MALTATAIVGAVSANSVQAAPAGLAAIISTAALSGTTITTAAVLAAIKTIAMTTLQKALVTAALITTIGAGVFEAHQVSQLREQTQTLQQRQAALADQLAQLQRERDDATNQLASLLAENAQLKSNSNEDELLKLRAEVTRLRTVETPKSSDPLMDSATEVLAVRINKLKQRLEQESWQKIPELQLLDSHDWLQEAALLGKDPSADQEFNKALAELRETAKKNFAVDGHCLG